MTREKMQAARELIKKKRYTEARAILQDIDNPLAKQWLARIDRIEQRKVARRGVRLWQLIGGIIVLAVVLLIIINRLNRPAETAELGRSYTALGMTVQYPDGWAAVTRQGDQIVLASSNALLERIDLSDTAPTLPDSAEAMSIRVLDAFGSPEANLELLRGDLAAGTQLNGQQIVPPAQVGAVESLTVNGRRAAALNFTLNDVSAKIVLVSLSDSRIAQFTGFADDIAAFDSLFMAIVAAAAFGG